MPLLGIFTKKSNLRLKTSGTPSNAGHNASDISLDDEDYVSVASPNVQQPDASSSRLGLPPRRPLGQDQRQHSSYLDPLLEPPPRRSSLFQNYQDDPSTNRSTQSLPDGGDCRTIHPQAHPQQGSQSSQTSATNTAPKKSMFSWKSNRDRSRSAPPVKPQLQEGSSFNLKSFRHVRPESPLSQYSSSVLPPIPTSTPTSAMSSPTTSFQVTSRRPRDNATPDLTVSIPQQTTATQQKMAAGVFRQAARRSTTSLILTDSPLHSPVSPTRSFLDDRPPPSLLPPPQTRPTAPTRPPRSLPPHGAPPSAFRAVSPMSTPRKSINAFTGSSSSSSSSEEEDEDENSDSTDGGVGLSRKTTIKPRVGARPPLSSFVSDRTQRITSPPDPAPPRAQSSLGVYGPGSRQRASMSVGALSPSAREARASIAVATNLRTMDPPRPPPKRTATPVSTTAGASAPAFRRAAGSDTSESASGSDSDEDAPLSSLVPRRPGTAMSSHSSPGPPRKPLVDLEAPSTMTGRPVRAPPPITWEEEDGRSKTRVSTDLSSRNQNWQVSKMSPISSPQNSKMSQAPSSTRTSQSQTSQGSKVSQALSQQSPKTSSAQQSSRTLQPSSPQSSRPLQGRSLVSLDTPTTPTGHATRSNLSPPPVAPAMRPFARRESPASSTGDSSSGKAPLTPRDGSDLGGGTRSAYSGSAGRSRPAHGRKPSVTFEDEQERGATGKSRARDNVNPQEARLRERRRTEARAAIELGNVVNGPPPVDEDDVAVGHPVMQAGWTQPAMQIPMPPFPPMFNMGVNMSMPPQAAFGFGAPPPGADPAYLAAHQQAMAIAKQTFQYTVAQQALAAANDEWERNSNVGAQWGGSQWGGGSGYGLGLGMGMRTSAVFPPAPRSMYAGSVGGGGVVGAQWAGAGSVYGETFGPARQSVYSQGDFSAPVSAQQRPTRPRTTTAPSSSTPPLGTGVGRMLAPPSSFRRFGH